MTFVHRYRHCQYSSVRSIALSTTIAVQSHYVDNCCLLSTPSMTMPIDVVVVVEYCDDSSLVALNRMIDSLIVANKMFSQLAFEPSNLHSHISTKSINYSTIHNHTAIDTTQLDSFVHCCNLIHQQVSLSMSAASRHCVEHTPHMQPQSSTAAAFATRMLQYI